MPLKDPLKRRAYHRTYDHERYQRMRAKLIAELGGKCVVCGTMENLEVHHIEPVNSRSRTRAKSHFKPEEKELRCIKHHPHTETWRGKRKIKRGVM